MLAGDVIKYKQSALPLDLGQPYPSDTCVGIVDVAAKHRACRALKQKSPLRITIGAAGNRLDGSMFLMSYFECSGSSKANTGLVFMLWLAPSLAMISATVFTEFLPVL